MKVCVLTCKYDELDKEAKERALKQWRENWPPDGWWEGVCEDARYLGRLMGIEVEDVYFRLFSQGAGAQFNGTYSYRPGGLKAVQDEAPGERELHRIAKSLQAIQKNSFYGLTAAVRPSGRGEHWYATRIDVHDRYGNLVDHPALEDALRDFMRWIYRRLEKMYLYEVSEEGLEEAIRVSDPWFWPDGTLAFLPERFILEMAA